MKKDYQKYLVCVIYLTEIHCNILFSKRQIRICYKYYNFCVICIFFTILWYRPNLLTLPHYQPPAKWWYLLDCRFFSRFAKKLIVYIFDDNCKFLHLLHTRHPLYLPLFQTSHQQYASYPAHQIQRYVPKHKTDRNHLLPYHSKISLPVTLIPVPHGGRSD